MATLAELLGQRSELEAARNGGLRALQDASGRRVEYKTDAEMATAIAALDRQIAALRGGPITTVRITSSKGL